MTEIILSKKAVEDLNNIWIYTAETWSVEQANRYYNLIMDEIEYVSENFNTTKDVESIRKGYRYSKVKSHLIFFRQMNTNEIDVVRILHEKMDIRNRIKE